MGATEVNAVTPLASRSANRGRPRTVLNFEPGLRGNVERQPSGGVLAHS